MIISLAFAVVFAATAFAQSGTPQAAPRFPDDGPPQDQRRPNLLRELGLSPEQLQQLKQINQERRPQMEAALRRLGNANRALDEAIYADVVNEADVASRLKEVQDAQGEVAQLRFTNELQVRRILTPEQLVRFRDLRRQFAEAREKLRNERRGPNSDRPFRRMIRPAKQVQE
jgi:Spy/CpxP family protein refolding chaperone